jgi:nitrite transporter
LYSDTLNALAESAQKKAGMARRFPLPFLVGAMMAGAYVGLGIILIFSLGASLEPGWQRLVMGASFGIALTLVVFAGADLFTGYTLSMAVGWLHRTLTASDLARVWAISWLGNLLGALLLAGIFVAGGGGVLLGDGAPLLYKVASAKMNGPGGELFARAILCNWLVCLALWMAARTASDAAKLGVIFWCLFAFIASGYEHSVANMTLFSIALLGEHPDTVSLAGMARNLAWVSLGNVVGGSVFMAAGYWVSSPSLWSRERAAQGAEARAVLPEEALPTS